MQRRTWSAMFMGGTLGAILGIAIVALAAGRVIGSGVESIPVLNEPARATFVVEQSALYLLILTACAAGGAILAVTGSAVGRLGGPDEARFPLGPLALVGAATGAVLGFAVARAAIGVGGTISGGTVSLSVFRAVMAALITGAATGAVMGGGIERLSRRQVLGLGGAAWPSDPLRFMRDAAAAIGIPALGLTLAAGLVLGLSQILLEADRTMSIITFGGVAVLVLGGASAIAAIPQRRGNKGTSSPDSKG